MRFWMAWGDAIDLLEADSQLGVHTTLQSLETYSEMLQVIEGDFIPRQVKK